MYEVVDLYRAFFLNFEVQKIKEHTNIAGDFTSSVLKTQFDP